MARRPADRAEDAPDGRAGDAAPAEDGATDAPRGGLRADRAQGLRADAPPAADRAAYQAEQAALLRALIHGEELPDGFAPGKAAAASRSLWRKRMRAVEAAWPALTIGLGADFERRFETFARAVPPPALGWGFTDGLAFALSLARAELTDDARVELLLARAVVVTGRGGTFRERRGVYVGARLLQTPRRFLVVTRVPVAGRRVLAVALGRRH